jgi:alpha-tubulin suppressor-like RCC1 family protein
MNTRDLVAVLLRCLPKFVAVAAFLVAGLETVGAEDLKLGASQRVSGVILSSLPTAGNVQPTVSVGGGHTLAVDQEGNLWAWGKNDKGQIGDGSTENRNAPVKIARDGVRWVAVAAGLNFSLAIDNDGKLWAWGSNTAGQLGDGTNSDSLIPKQVGTATDWRAVSAGDFHALALKGNGELYSWGSNQSGQLGRSLTAVSGVVPSMSMTPGSVSGAWKAVSAGGSHSLAIGANNVAQSWGANYKGQLGRLTGSETDGVPADAFSGVSVNSVAAGGDFSVLLEVSGAVSAHGDNQFDQAPSGVPLATNATLVVAGRQHALALLQDGSVKAWGRNDSGQAPSSVDLGGGTPVGIAAGGKTSLVVFADGSVSTFGRNIEGQHGNGATQIETTPVNKFPSGSYTQVQMGDRHTLAIDEIGKLWAWGDNSVGQLGDGTIVDSSVPVTPSGLGGSNWTKIAVGANNSAAINAAGELYVWGSNYDGQLGNGSTTASLLPLKVSGTWNEVALGDGHVLAINSDKKLFAWGNNMNSQLGWAKVGTQTNQLSPKQVGSATDWAKVAAGQNHSLGLRGTTLYGWGQNVLGQLGNGSNTDATSPVKIGNLSWDLVQAGGSTSAGISAGKLYVWGNNDRGQLGDKGTQPSNTPKQFLKDLGFTSVGVSPTAIAAVAQGGKIWVSGSNDSGRIGYGSVSGTKTPVELAAPANVTSVSLGGAAGAALDSARTLHVWGSNKYGQLGESADDLGADKAIVPQSPSVSILAIAKSGAGSTSASGSLSYAEGDSVVFAANASGTGPFTYQWRKDGVDINGATGPTHEIASAGPLSAGGYDVVVSSAYGSNVESTNSITAVPWLAPQITEQPVAVNALGGTNAVLKVTAIGTDLSSASYAWRSVSSGTVIGTGTSFSANAPGDYKVTVSSSKNGTSVSVTSGTVAVRFYDQVVLQAPDNNTNRVGSGSQSFVKSLVSGSGLFFSVNVTSDLTGIQYQWRKDLQDIPEATSATLNVTATAATAGLYSVVVSNPASTVISSGIAVRVYSSPVFTRQPASQTVADGRAVVLSVSAQGYSTPTLQWYGPDGLIEGGTASTLTVTGFSAAKAGAYYAVASNESSSTTSEKATLSLPGLVEGKPTILIHPQSQAVVAGGTATFMVKALDATQYQWRKNGVPIPGATGTDLVVGNVTAVDVASYSVLVSNSVTSVLSTAATISLRSIVDGDARRSLFNAVFGSNGGLFSARLSGSALPAGTPQGYIRLNFTRAGTVSGAYTSGNKVIRFASRFVLSGENQVAEVPLAGGASTALRFTITADPSNPVASVRLVPSDNLQSATTSEVVLARLGVKNLTLSAFYTGTFQDPSTGIFHGYSSTRVNLNSGIVSVTGMLPLTGERFTASSSMYADPLGVSPASMTDFVVRLSETRRLFSTWKLETASLGGDAVVVTGIANGTPYDVTGAKYAPAPMGSLLAPFVSSRDQAVVTYDGTEVSRFTAQANRLIPETSAFAAAGGRFSIRFISNTGVASGLVTLRPGEPPAPFTGVILQGGYRTNGGILGVGVTPAGITLRFEPAN